MDRAGIQDALAEAVTEQDEIELIAVLKRKVYIVILHEPICNEA